MDYLNKLRFLGVLACVLLAGCSGAGKQKVADEFAVLPTEPLEIPADIASLPAPDAGAENLVDKRPKALVVEALGGTAAGVAVGDTALVGVATRYGVDANIRAVLYREDAPARRIARKRNGLERAYKDQALNEQEEAARLLALGVKVPQR